MAKETIDLLLSRRSVKPLLMVEPGPDDAALELILRAGARVPDHGKLAPWRFITFRGDTRRKFGQVLREIFAKVEPRADEDRLAFEANRFLQAPLVVAVIHHPVESMKAPEWEQVLSTGAVCQNMLVAAKALGFVSCWLTEWYSYDASVALALGLESDERVAGFIYFGSASQPVEDRPRPQPDEIRREWTRSE